MSQASDRELAPHHRVLLEQAIHPEVISERAYWSAPDWQALKAGGVHLRQSQLRTDSFPAMVVPQWGPGGEPLHSIVRWDHPRVTPGGRVVKYDQPPAVGLRIDVPPRCVERLRDPALPIWITEGSRKADALASRGAVAISIPGVWGWRGPDALPDLYSIRFKGRVVYLAFDSDVLIKPPVQRALGGLTAWLSRTQGADVRIIDWRRLAGVAA